MSGSFWVLCMYNEGGGCFGACCSGCGVVRSGGVVHDRAMVALIFNEGGHVGLCACNAGVAFGADVAIDAKVQCRGASYGRCIC